MCILRGGRKKCRLKLNYHVFKAPVGGLDSRINPSLGLDDNKVGF